MTEEKIYLSSPHMSDEGYEEKYVQEAFDTNWIAPLGNNVNEFEKQIIEYTGVDHAVALSSGTAALHLAVRAAGVGPGDIVLCQDLTFAASANPIIYQGANPVFIDSDLETWNMSVDALKEGLEKYPEAKAVIAVNLYGISAHLDQIKELCQEYDVFFIEDAAESLGTYFKDKPTGTFGDISIFSFNGNKILTSSGGGMLVTNSAEIDQKTRFWATQAKDPARYYQHSDYGYNYRLSNVCAGIGRGQMHVLKDRVEKKQYIYKYYKKELGDLEGLSFMPWNSWDNPNCWLTSIQLEGDIRPLDLILALEEEQIESRPVWKPMSLQPFYEDRDYIGTGVSHKLFEDGLCLPSDTKMSDEDLQRVCRIIKNLW